eukprot:7463063-Pyramimonas_sp.AAC.1
MVNNELVDAVTYLFANLAGVAPAGNPRAFRVLEAPQRSHLRAAFAASHAAIPSYAQRWSCD